MSTRCQIRIKDEYRSVELYHHHDGYPEGVGADLKEYCSKLPNDKWSYWSIRRITNDFLKGELKLEHCDGTIEPDMGYELALGFHSDIEYAYLIDCEKRTLQGFKLSYSEDYEDLDDVFENAKVVEIPEKSN
jgi:hypothetical protein